MAEPALLTSPKSRVAAVRPLNAIDPLTESRRFELAYDARLVTAVLEDAGRTLLALPASGYSTKLRTSQLEIVRAAADAYGWTEKNVRPAIPSAAKITEMDEALAWIPLIPVENHVLRRIVGCRCLVHPISDRHLFTWRRLGGLLHADHKAVQRWHAQGIDIIVAALNQRRR